MINIRSLLFELYNRRLEKKELMPWRNNFYKELFLKSENRISSKRAYLMLQLLASTTNIDGDVCEMGVYRGGTAYLLADLLVSSKVNKKIFLFDTFSGTPKISEKDNINRAGSYSTTNLDQVKKHLRIFSDITEFIPGIIPDSFKNTNIKKISFANIHVNVYEATIASLDFVFSRMPIGGIILVQDYGNKRCLGVKEAVDEFYSDKKSRPVYLTNKQCAITKIDE